MEIQQMLLTVNPYSRPGTKLAKVTSVACHYVGNPNSTAINNRNYFESLKDKKTTHASSHYIIGLQGEIIQCIPENEISYCTNVANSYTISIEACHPDSTGKFNEATYRSYVWLCADICKRYGLNPVTGGLIRHYDVTRKVCPKWFVDNPSAWEVFKQEVKSAIEPIKEGWNKQDNKWIYVLNGSMIKGDWYKDDGDWYVFDDNGYMRTGWVQYKNKWYYLKSDGKMQTGWLELSGKWYYLDMINGDMKDGWFENDGKWYYFDSSGLMQTGMTNINGKWYYFNTGQLGTSSDYGALLVSNNDGELSIFKD